MVLPSAMTSWINYLHMKSITNFCWKSLPYSYQFAIFTLPSHIRWLQRWHCKFTRKKTKANTKFTNLDYITLTETSERHHIITYKATTLNRQQMDLDISCIERPQFKQQTNEQTTRACAKRGVGGLSSFPLLCQPSAHLITNQPRGLTQPSWLQLWIYL